jgi:hypothetical protein
MKSRSKTPNVLRVVIPNVIEVEGRGLVAVVATTVIVTLVIMTVLY